MRVCYRKLHRSVVATASADEAAMGVYGRQQCASQHSVGHLLEGCMCLLPKSFKHASEHFPSR